MNKHDLENAKRALEEFKQEKKNEVNVYMQDILNQVNDYLVEENSKEQDEFVKDFIDNSLQLLKDEEKNALEKYSCLIHGIGAFETFERYIDQEPENRDEGPFQDWLKDFEAFINELVD